MIAITTNNSTSVNPLDKPRLLLFTVIRLLKGASKNASDPNPSDFHYKTERFDREQTITTPDPAKG
jgi:hypothetical protein